MSLVVRCWDSWCIVTVLGLVGGAPDSWSCIRRRARGAAPSRSWSHGRPGRCQISVMLLVKPQLDLGGPEEAGKTSR